MYHHAPILRMCRLPLIIGTIALLMFLSPSASAQDPSCATAVWQLQNYANQVNAFANNEYYQGIPLRCQGNPICMNQWLGNLNQWYQMQSNQVSLWYSQIVRQCTTTQRTPLPTPGDPRNPIDTDEIENIELADEDQTVRIKIPTTPKGYQ